ncbi:hypothetical protein RIR_jg32538.t1 [Rhizophagus irregularis DAOM 181602=DAOM 197198]|nr:hypothetical protein RIR_jg32538.t1 [Rhizophagus irregularis DAOM 181602=DAOM 197198]
MARLDRLIWKEHMYKLKDWEHSRGITTRKKKLYYERHKNIKKQRTMDQSLIFARPDTAPTTMIAHLSHD